MRVARFGRSERTAHWIHALGFLAMLGSGLVLYLPALSASIGDRPLIKSVHLAAAAAWLTGLALVAVLGDRRALRRTRRELERFDADDGRWLRLGRAPQGRFNAGQKVHAVLQAALAVLFTVSGALLWLGERNTDLRLPGTLSLHDASMFIATAFVLGHLYLALLHPSTRPALSGMVRGHVDGAWARRHHAKWRAAAARPSAPWRPTVWQAVLATIVALGGLAGAIALVADVAR